MAELDKIQLGQTEYDIRDANALPKSGGTMTGALILYRNPTTAKEAATKQYVDAVRPTTSPRLPPSGAALTANTIYGVTAAVNTYTFYPPPSNGWAHGTFTTGTAPNITFTGKIIGKLPNFAASKQYEFDVYNGAWIVQEVVTQ